LRLRHKKLSFDGEFFFETTQVVVWRRSPIKEGIFSEITSVLG
jgi:hypothetical protein